MSRASTTLTWLHLSDLHWNDNEAYDQNVVLTHLLEDLYDLPKIYKKLAEIDLIFVTGDIAFSGQVREYELASRFFDDLRRVTKVPAKRVLLIPGNHDISRSVFQDETLRLRRSLNEHRHIDEFLHNSVLRSQVFQRQENFRKFALEYTSVDKYKEYFYSEVMDINTLQLGVVGLNSAWLCADNNDRTQLLLGEPQVTEALKQIQEADLRIALVHHPFSWLQEFDQETCERDILTRCDFVLRGHLHRTDVTRQRNPDANVYLLAAGASYETRDSLNAYNLVHLEFDENRNAKGTAYSRVWSPGGRFWTDDVLTYKNRNGRFPISVRQRKTHDRATPPSSRSNPPVESFVPVDSTSTIISDIAQERPQRVEIVKQDYDEREKWWKDRGYKGNPFQISNSRDVMDDQVWDFWDWHQPPHVRWRKEKKEIETIFIGKQTVSEIAKNGRTDIVVVYAPRGGGKTFYAKLCKKRVEQDDSRGVTFYIKNYDTFIAIKKITSVDLAHHVHLQLWEQLNQRDQIARLRPLQLLHINHILLECEKLFTAQQRCYVFLDNLDQIFLGLNYTEQEFQDKVTALAGLVNATVNRGGVTLALRFFLPIELKAAFHKQLDANLLDKIHEYELVWQDTDCQQLLETRLETCFESTKTRPAPNIYLLGLAESDVIDGIFQELKRMQPLTPRRSLRLMDDLTLFCYPRVKPSDKISWEMWQEFIALQREA